MTNQTISKRPYLVRAMHEWMGDNGNTPHIVIDASIDGVSVPEEHVKDGRIVLNISESAAHNLKLGNDGVSFRARFGGVPFDVCAPMHSVLGIYARESGQGMIFSHDSVNGGEIAPAHMHEPNPAQSRAAARTRSHLRLVK